MLCIKNTSTYRRRLAAIFCCLTLGTVGQHAFATTLYKLGTGTSWTYWTGTALESSSSNKFLGGTRDYKAIHRITNYEKNNHPCKMKIKMRHLNQYTATTEYKSLMSNCNNDKITVGFSDTETYITGLQVCEHNQRIKGLRVYGKKLNRHTGRLIDAGEDEDKRPNCNNWWDHWVLCDEGKVATRIKAAYDGDDFVGIALACREIIVQ